MEQTIKEQISKLKEERDKLSKELSMVLEYLASQTKKGKTELKVLSIIVSLYEELDKINDRLNLLESLYQFK